MHLKAIILKLQELDEYTKECDPEVVLIVGGFAFPVDQIWWEPQQRGSLKFGSEGAVCVGDDPR